MLSALPKVLKAYLSWTILWIYVPKSVRVFANFTVSPYFLNFRWQYKQVKENIFNILFFCLFSSTKSYSLNIYLSEHMGKWFFFPRLVPYISFLISFILKILILILKNTNIWDYITPVHIYIYTHTYMHVLQVDKPVFSLIWTAYKCACLWVFVHMHT